jgi:TolB-like protein
VLDARCLGGRPARSRRIASGHVPRVESTPAHEEIAVRCCSVLGKVSQVGLLIGLAGRYGAGNLSLRRPRVTVQTIGQLYREARRRKVFRTAALYVLGAWVALQVADVLFPGFGIPEAAIQALVWTAVLGFPVALVFGWLFEIGPDGIRRTPPLARGETAERQPLARRDYLLLAAFVAVAGALAIRAVQQVRETPVETGTGVTEATGEAIARLVNSVAVLPFANISNDPDNEYFCDGISEEILNEISKVRQLTVIGRTSSFAFKGSDAGIEKISAVLGVQYVLQGSVRKAGSQLRISAQLLDERGRQLWTQTFDRELANVFEIQAEIAQSVAAMVTREVVSRPGIARHPNLEAYDHYLAGRERLHKRDSEGAMTELERAIELDPGFAEAHAEWAIARSIGVPSTQQLNTAAAAIERAFELRPQLLRAQAARGLWLLQSTPADTAAAESTLRAVLQQDPNMSDALLWLSNALREQGRSDESFEILQRAYRIDPLNPSIAINLSNALFKRGKDEEGLNLLERQLQQPNPGSWTYLALLDSYRWRGRLVEMNALAKGSALHAASQIPLAQSYALIGDLTSAEYWVERWMEWSLKDRPDSVFNLFYPSIVPDWRGDAELARQLFDQGLDAGKVRIEDQNQGVQIWYGALLARSGRYSAAIEVLEPFAVVAPTPGSLNLWSMAPQFDGWHALAWSYRHSGNAAEATEILSGLQDQCRLQVDDPQHPVQSNLLHYCAETALLAGDTEQSLDLLRRAIDAGWRDYYVRQNDPYWSALEGDPRYRALMDTVKVDIDRQRSEVERIDATDDFEARLDAALAGRRSSGE